MSLGTITDASNAVMFYVPLEVDTYVPITKDDIEKRAFFRCALESLPSAFFMREQSPLVSFDKKKIRAKIVQDRSVYLVDKNAFVKFDGHIWRLGGEEFAKIIEAAECIRTKNM